ncbi:MAG: hypothetical protein LBD88_05195 [Candidatus Peribacteria bacterium]|nr:hypothetical protein [Candidatus Peribacteria bacterium]
MEEVLRAYDYSKVKSSNYSFVINDNYVKLVDNAKVKKIVLIVDIRDIFQLIHLAISYFLAQDNLLLVHSTLVSKNGNGILLIGDFGQGKTFLSKKFKEHGYEINSGDSTVIMNKNNKLFSTYGSKKIVSAKEISFINTNLKLVRIKKILLLVGIGVNADYVPIQIVDTLQIFWKLWQHTTWQFTTPLTNRSIKVVDWLPKELINLVSEYSKSNCPFFSIRGDSEKIVLNS